MVQASDRASATIEDDEIDRLRALTWRLLARFLAAPPDAAALEAAARLGEPETELGRALSLLGRIASKTNPAEAEEEYHALFIGVGRGELVPYASFYRTGFLNEKPLALLRQDLAELGIARAEGNPEPEDHIASLCEVMAGLAEGRFGTAGLATQQRFFDRHLAPWAGRFFADLEAARSARLYQPVGTVGRLFVEIERTAFALAA